MLKLVFAEAGPSSTVEVGPLPEICIDGETMRATRGGEILGISRTARASPRRCSVPTKQWIVVKSAAAPAA